MHIRIIILYSLIMNNPPHRSPGACLYARPKKVYESLALVLWSHSNTNTFMGGASPPQSRYSEHNRAHLFLWEIVGLVSPRELTSDLCRALSVFALATEGDCRNRWTGEQRRADRRHGSWCILTSPACFLSACVSCSCWIAAPGCMQAMNIIVVIITLRGFQF